MKKLVAGLAAGLLLGSVSYAGASALRSPSASGGLHFHGVVCHTYIGDDAVICMPESGSGYAVAVSTSSVSVMTHNGPRVHIVLTRKQPPSVNWGTNLWAYGTNPYGVYTP